MSKFLGMCSFYRKHIPQFAKVATLLRNLTRVYGEFNWTDRCQEAFDGLKVRLAQASVSIRVNVDHLFIVISDASTTHVCGVLSQVQPDGKNKTASYFSEKLKSAGCKYSATDNEALAMVLTCCSFHHYLWSTKFIIAKDHQPLTIVCRRKTKSPRMNRWILKMREYRYDI